MWSCHLTESRSGAWRKGPPSRVLRAHSRLLLGSKVRAPLPRSRLPPLGDPRAHRSGRHFPSGLQGASPPRPSSRLLRAWGRPRGRGTRLGARASARTMTPSPLAASSSRHRPPRSPQANLLAIQTDKTPRPRALSRGAPGHRH